MKSEDFEKEFCNYFNNFKDTPESDTWLDMHQARRFARHFMKWQKEQDERLINLAKDSWYKEGFVKGQIEGLSEEEKYQQGRFDEREQMLKDAVNGEVVKTLGGSLRVSSYIFKRDGFKFGDKVKIIIVKEDEK